MIVIAISCIYNHILTPKLIMMHTLVYTNIPIAPAYTCITRITCPLYRKVAMI